VCYPLGVSAARSDAFGDAHPFDWMDARSPEEIEATFNPLLVRTLEESGARARVVDVGCGAGRLLTWLAARGRRGVGVDVSRRSLELARERSGLSVLRGDNLALPLRDGAVDLVVSDGVIHHTADPAGAFAENCRVLRPGGRLYLGVYEPGGRYEWLVRHVAPPVRRLVRRPAGRALVHGLLLTPYYLAHRIRSRGRTSWRSARNLFYDYLVRPIIEFIDAESVRAWAREAGMTVAVYEPNPGSNLHLFVLRKEAPPASAARGDRSSSSSPENPRVLRSLVAEV
jgi:SAM-dependent methyltransferase